MVQPRAVVLQGPGSNCDREAALGWELAGAQGVLLPLNTLIEQPQRLAEYQILTIPGGFTYGDDLGAGKLLAVDLICRLGDALQSFRMRGGLIIGICNGFQILVKAGMLHTDATLYANDSGRFECRWVELSMANRGKCLWVSETPQRILLPVAHGEGKFVPRDATVLRQLQQQDQVVLSYAASAYPANPNGSVADIAGICDSTGQVFGLMPHPERHLWPWHHPAWTRQASGVEAFRRREQGDGLTIFKSAVKACQ
ncbi:MAG: phosphoribosylformylglycinamidine synthase I [Chloroflexi bacterium]|nr:phosphoribosylformylglycinamidine synthase I [Chloroflexota bacterium]